ncbi:MAG: Rab family GTPase [Candidatus Thorarchaeota archaeon]
MSKKARNTLKMILVGDPSVGKTSLIQQYVHGRFKHSYQVTIGLDVLSKTISLSDREIEISINDIGGQARFATLRQLFYNGTHLAMLVYDCTRPQTLQNLITTWNNELEKFCLPIEGQPHIVKIMVGNKVDLTDLRTVTEEEGIEIANKLHCINHIVASAKENENVDLAFTEITKAYLGLIEKK